MAISLIKEFKQTQKVSLTPLLKKSIDLLQLSRYELIQKIESEIEVNPFIEKEELEDFDFQIKNSEDFDFEIAASESLRENLIKQITDLRLDKDSSLIALSIIDGLDESGQLIDEIEDLKSIMNFKFNFNEIENILLNVIHKLEPAGIGFRNFKECIKIQIVSKQLPQKIKDIAENILLQSKSDDLDNIRKELVSQGLDARDIDKAIHEIKSCDLSPGLNFEHTNFVIPDIRIRLENNELYTDFVTDNFPKIKIDEDLLDSMGQELKKIPNKELAEKIQDAKWLISSVKKRNDTIFKVGELICKKQISFFGENPLKINPLSNKELAEELNLHPSTISRILRSKYIDTPKGIMLLKSLLVSSVSKTRNVTPLQLMQLIKNIISEEKNPKSDNKIAVELNKRGFNLARRTITKYRKKLNLPSSRNR
ncbi:RNA polymerase factor sigma-54 [Gammaproteobacteria bacterium]|nr:RNA polymerase factor sigma-54 [Gammaproteobacteria bacterium]MDB3915137.1 RNA polymerase factor sigma-54 [Gammaproteobacteria bacterium]MDC1470852.1 RNA polymerase factor sigma-54 [Gammaproteobacteria bacterium]